MRKRLLLGFKRLLIAYIILLTALYFGQRYILFPAPQASIQHPSFYGLENFDESWIQSNNGPKIKIWHNDIENKEKIIVYFHGNGEILSSNHSLFGKLDIHGYGVVGFSYRGYGDNEGSPSEEGIFDDAQETINFITEKTSGKISLVGRSLGSGIAVKLASDNDLDKVVLISPYTSIANVAADLYWFFPVKQLIWDEFDSLSRIDKIEEDILIIHGEKDGVVPIKFGRELFEAIKSDKKFVTQKNRGHNNLDSSRIIQSIKDWI